MNKNRRATRKQKRERSAKARYLIRQMYDRISQGNTQDVTIAFITLPLRSRFERQRRANGHAMGIYVSENLRIDPVFDVFRELGELRQLEDAWTLQGVRQGSYAPSLIVPAVITEFEGHRMVLRAGLGLPATLSTAQRFRFDTMSNIAAALDAQLRALNEAMSYMQVALRIAQPRPEPRGSWYGHDLSKAP